MKPLPKYLKADSFPTNITDVPSWFGLVNKVAHYAQLRDFMAPMKQLLSSKAQFYWTDELQTSFDDSRKAIVDSIK